MATLLDLKNKIQEFFNKQVVPQFQQGIQRVRQTPAREFFLPTATATKRLVGPALSALGPLDVLVAAAIRKENKPYGQRIKEEIQRGGDIVSALQTRNVPLGAALPLGLAAGFAIPGAGELSSLKNIKKLGTAGKVVPGISRDLQPLAQEVGYKKFVKNAYLVVSKQKNQAQVARIKSAFGLPTDTPEKIILRAETFDKILEKHPDRLNVDFNKALGFVKTLNLPDAVSNLPEKQRINFIRNIANDYLNLVGVKPVIQKGETYLNTSFITSKLSKYGPEGLAIPSSPIGVGARLPTSDTSTRSISNLSNKSELDAFLRGEIQDVMVQRPAYTQATGGIGRVKVKPPEAIRVAPAGKVSTEVPQPSKLLKGSKEVVVPVKGGVVFGGGAEMPGGLGGLARPSVKSLAQDKYSFNVKGGIKVKPPEVGRPIKITQEQISPVKVLSQEPQIQKQTRTVLQEVNLKQLKQPVSETLPNIIQKESIDVKEKVGILDYLRTPDRVLEKIGFKKEADTLRRQYDSYIKQVPQEIQRITKWSKQVPAESSQRIFKFLDGQPIQLNKQELKVAGEIKAYLKGWADKLGLPEEKRITNYITHIFEKDFIKKEFDPEIAKLIQNRVPGSIYDPFVEQRLGKLGYVEDVWRALDAYVKRATRKVNLDPILKQMKEKARGLEISQYNYLKKYTQGINMRPTDLDSLLDNQIKQIFGYRFGQRPTNLLTRAGRQAVFRGTLGLNVGTALRNLTQGVNTYAKLGEKYLLKGYWDLLTNGTDELKRVGALADDLIQDRNLNVKRQAIQKLDKALFYFFDTAEKINRGSAYYGAKAKALAVGLSEEQAINYAKKIVRDTQFTFGKIDTPVALQSDMAKMLAQFQTFTLKQVEFLGEMAKNKEYAGLVRYTLGSLAVLFSVGKLIGLEPKDMIPSFRIGIPPTLQTPVEMGKALLGAPDRYGNKQTPLERMQKVGESLVPYIPGGVQVKKTIQGLTDVSKGYSETPSGRVRFPVGQDVSNYLRGGLFGRWNLPEAQEYFKEKGQPLGEKQSELFKTVSPEERPVLYQSILKSRESNKQVDELKEAIEQGKQVSTNDPKLQEELAKLRLDYENKPFQIANNRAFYLTEAGGKSSVSLNFNVKEPQWTNNATLNKELLADYRGAITKAKNAIMKAWELGVIDQDQAILELDKLITKSNATKKALSLLLGVELLISKSSNVVASGGLTSKGGSLK